ncbi:D-methionine-binding lipoprotein MetQ precursor [compost metagenome]
MKLPFGRRSAILSVLGLTLLAGISSPIFAQAEEFAPIRIGINAGLSAAAVNQAAKEAAEKGLKVEVIEFTDWVVPNEALKSKEIDVNYFQHQPFLDQNAKKAGYDFVSVGVGTLTKLGLYSKKYKSIEELPEGAKVAISDDPVNGGRALELLQSIGLIKLKDGLTSAAIPADIVENPKKLDIIELPNQQIPRALDDVDLGQGYPSGMGLFGVDPNSALVFDGVQTRYALRFFVRKEYEANKSVQEFVRTYQNSPEVRAILKKHFGDLTVPAWD